MVLTFGFRVGHSFPDFADAHIDIVAAVPFVSVDRLVDGTLLDSDPRKEIAQDMVYTDNGIDSIAKVPLRASNEDVLSYQGLATTVQDTRLSSAARPYRMQARRARVCTVRGTAAKES